MSSKKNIDSKNESLENKSEESKNSKTGYMARGNSSKIAAEQGTRNKN